MARQVLGKDPFAKKPSPPRKSDAPQPRKNPPAPAKKAAPPAKPSAGRSDSADKAEPKPEPKANVPPQAAAGSPAPAPDASSLPGVSWQDDLGDGFGYNPEYESSVQGALDMLYAKYSRVEIDGIGNLPKDGKALLVANHAGVLPYDSLMIREAIRRNTPGKRLVRPLLEDFIYYFPFVGTMMGKLGAVRACQENGQLLLSRNQMVLVFPEGIKGITKEYSQRYRLQRFGRGGFVRLAIASRAAIVPVAVIGSEETYPIISNMEQVAKVIGLPYLPLTPTFPWLGPLGLLPLPSKWKIVFGKPIPFDEYTPDQAHDRVLITKLVERVRSRLQSMIDKELAARKSVWR